MESQHKTGLDRNLLGNNNLQKGAKDGCQAVYVLCLYAEGVLLFAAGMVTDAFSDFVVGHGELWCANLFASTIQQQGIPCKFMDTRQVLTVTSPDGKIVDVEYEASDANLDNWARKNGIPEVRSKTNQFQRAIKRVTRCMPRSKQTE